MQSLRSRRYPHPKFAPACDAGSQISTSPQGGGVGTLYLANSPATGRQAGSGSALSAGASEVDSGSGAVSSFKAAIASAIGGSPEGSAAAGGSVYLASSASAFDSVSSA